MTTNRKILFTLFVLIIGAQSCSLFSSKTSDGEAVLAPTEVGTPQGDKITKEIGPGGGTLASPDGRLTLTVPQNALAETVAFSIQPITNKANGGLGLAYRLEPNGKTFSAPLQVSIRYDEHDLEGTIPEALSLGYQDEKGTWHLQKAAKLDQAAKTLNISTTHFSDWSFLSRLSLNPSKATLGVGIGLPIQVIITCERSWMEKILNRQGGDCKLPTTQQNRNPWKLQGAGTIELAGYGVIYTAPAKKPTPNVVHVLFSYEFEQWDETRIDKVEGTMAVEITIIDGGYMVSGSAGGDTLMSGVICDLEKPFTVTTNNPFIAPVEFTPSSANGGSWKFATKGGVVGGGSGQYTVEGTNTEKTGIQMSGDSSAYGQGHGIRTPTLSGGGDIHLTLTPLIESKCGGG